MREEFAESEARSSKRLHSGVKKKQSQGGTLLLQGWVGGGGLFCSAYLEVVVRVSGFILPGIAGC